MGDMINSLLNLSRYGRKKVKKSRVDLIALVQEALEEVDAANPSAKTQVVIRTLHPVYADIELLRQVLVNLISNAFKYSNKKEQPVVEIGTAVHSTEIVCYVKDNGVGFDMRYVDKLFGVFQRLHSASEFEGTGIGLAIVQRIIMHHGGRVWAEAETDRGATFYFSLPVE